MREALLLLPKTRMGERMAQKIKRWVATRSVRYTRLALHSVDMDGTKVHYIDNNKRIV